MSHKSHTSNQGWWLRLLNSIETSKRSAEFLEKFSIDVSSSKAISNNRATGETLSLHYTICDKSFKTFSGLKEICIDEYGKFLNSRKHLLDSLKLFTNRLNEAIILDSSNCHLHNSFVNYDYKKKKKCDLCKADGLFNAYGKYLFTRTDEILRVTHDEQTAENFDENADENTQQQSDQAIEHKLKCSSSDLERFFKSIISFCKQDDEPKDQLKIGKDFIDMYAIIKDEFHICRQFWMAVSNQINGIDEMSMAKIRIRLREPNDPVNTQNIPYIIDQNFFIYDAEVLSYAQKIKYHKNELLAKLGQMLYLENLMKVNFDFFDSSTSLSLF